MKQVICTAPFQVEVKDVPIPELQEDGDVLIKVSTSGLCGKSTGCVYRPRHREAGPLPHRLGIHSG